MPAGPGVYQKTPRQNAERQLAGWANVAPFGIHSGSQLRADLGEFFDPKGEAYTREYNEVKLVGRFDAQNAGNRTADQSATDDIDATGPP